MLYFRDFGSDEFRNIAKMTFKATQGHYDSSLYKLGSISVYFRFWVFIAYHSNDLDEPYKQVTSVFLISEH